MTLQQQSRLKVLQIDLPLILKAIEFHREKGAQETVEDLVLEANEGIEELTLFEEQIERRQNHFSRRREAV